MRDLWLVDHAAGILPAAIDRALVTGVARPSERVRLLAQGVGDAVGPSIAFEEFAIRARLVTERADRLPRMRRVGALMLDLLRREGFVGNRALALHPREFEMAWHLAALDGGGASRTQLLRDVWGVHHEPETNSVAVHAFRIRAKLRVHGLADMLATDRAGRYRLIALDHIAQLRDKAPQIICEERERDRTVL
jgi:DNA-binding response OmpR family regulator